MADKTPSRPSILNDVPVRLIDMGDGTFAELYIPNGRVAAGVADVGNPVKIGGVYKTTPPTYADGQRTDLSMDSRGSVYVTLRAVDSATGTAIPTPADAAANQSGLSVLARPMGYNGATWDRVRTPNTFKTLADAAATAGTGLTVWTPTAGKKFRLMGFAFSISVAGQIILKDSATEIARSPKLVAGDYWQLGAADMGNGILSALANNALKIDVSSTANVGGMAWGTEE